MRAMHITELRMLSKDPLGAPVLAAALKLMLALVSKTKK